MANVKLKNRQGNEVVYNNIITLQVPDADVDNTFDTFTLGEGQTKTATVTSAAQQVITPDAGKLLTQVTITVNIADWDGSVT